MLGGPPTRSGFPPPSGRVTPPRCGLFSLRRSHYGYSRSKGLFAGAALDGSVITIDDSANEKAFGREIDGDLALSGDVERPAIFQPFLDAVTEITPALAQ